METGNTECSVSSHTVRKEQNVTKRKEREKRKNSYPDSQVSGFSTTRHCEKNSTGEAGLAPTAEQQAEDRDTAPKG